MGLTPTVIFSPVFMYYYQFPFLYQKFWRKKKEKKEPKPQ